jgi:hypothetical protein
MYGVGRGAKNAPNIAILAVRPTGTSNIHSLSRLTALSPLSPKHLTRCLPFRTFLSYARRTLPLCGDGVVFSLEDTRDIW